MSAEFQNTATTESEPTSTLAVVPVWLIILTVVLVYWGAVYFDQHGGWFKPKVYGPYKTLAEVEHWQPPSPLVDPRGKQVFELTCALCHNTAGTGNPNQAPPMDGSEWVTGNIERLIRIPLNGLEGPITVKGQQMTFSSSMPAMGASLSEEDLAKLLTYIRQAWSNKTSPVTVEQVKKVRAEVGNRTQPWNAAELQKME
jgi:mono/diheme cytochrome c family protein